MIGYVCSNDIYYLTIKSTFKFDLELKLFGQVMSPNKSEIIVIFFFYVHLFFSFFKE